jgi:hypothetical protein
MKCSIFWDIMQCSSSTDMFRWNAFVLSSRLKSKHSELTFTGLHSGISEKTEPFRHTIYPSITSVVLYGRETWSLTLKEEHKLRVFENRMQRRIFRPKRDEERGRRRKLHTRNGLHNLYC